MIIVETPRTKQYIRERQCLMIAIECNHATTNVIPASTSSKSAWIASRCSIAAALCYTWEGYLKFSLVSIKEAYGLLFATGYIKMLHQDIAKLHASARSGTRGPSEAFVARQ